MAGKNYHFISRLAGLLLLMLVAVALLLACKKDPELIPDSTIPSHVISNIEYAANYDTSGLMQSLELNLYIPPKSDSEQLFPLVLMVHGGSYLQGNKEMLNVSCELLQNSGFIVGSIDYRLGWRVKDGCKGDKNTLAEAAYRGMQDANAAIRFLVANAKHYNIDTNWIFTAGESAGAAIALNSSYTTESDVETKYPELAQKLGRLYTAGNVFREKYTIKGICNKWGAISDSNLIRKGNLVPVICFQGTDDDVVPFDIGYFLGCSALPAFGSKCIYRQLKAANCATALYFIENGGHQPYEFTPEYTTAKTADFFYQLMYGNKKSTVNFGN